MTGVVAPNVDCRYADCRYANCYYADCHYADCRSAEYHNATCHFGQVSLYQVSLRLFLKTDFGLIPLRNRKNDTNDFNFKDFTYNPNFFNS